MTTTPRQLYDAAKKKPNSDDAVIWLLNNLRIRVDAATGDVYPTIRNHGGFHPNPPPMRRSCRGYYTASLTTPWGKKTVQAHRVVCIATHGMPPTPEHHVNHKNGIKGDNRPENLEWVTCAENRRHASENRLTPRGEQMPCAKLTEDKVREIRGRKKTGDTLTALALAYGVAVSTIERILARKVWKHVV